MNVQVTTPVGQATATNGFTYGTPTVSGVSPAAGPQGGGATVVITGTRFANTTSVMFGGAAATGFVINSDTQITATAPAGFGDSQHHGQQRLRRIPDQRRRPIHL